MHKNSLKAHNSVYLLDICTKNVYFPEKRGCNMHKYTL